MEYLNETILFFTGALSAGLVYIAWTLDKERLYSVIVIFLILISIGGSKIVEFFGHETNTGNIFYASVFLATYFLIERYGTREGVRSIWIGLVGALFFTIFLQLVIAFKGSESTASINEALRAAFEPSMRVALASLVGYALSQSLNVYLYTRLKQRFGQRHLWLRANATNAVAQALDSVVFFTIAFAGVVLPANIVDVMIAGFAIKVFFMMCAAPLLYLNTKLWDDQSDFIAERFR